MSTSTCPVRVDAFADQRLDRWLRLVPWVLAGVSLRVPSRRAD